MLVHGKLVAETCVSRLFNTLYEGAVYACPFPRTLITCPQYFMIALFAFCIRPELGVRIFDALNQFTYHRHTLPMPLSYSSHHLNPLNRLLPTFAGPVMGGGTRNTFEGHSSGQLTRTVRPISVKVCSLSKVRGRQTTSEKC